MHIRHISYCAYRAECRNLKTTFTATLRPVWHMHNFHILIFWNTMHILWGGYILCIFLHILLIVHMKRGRCPYPCWEGDSYYFTYWLTSCSLNGSKRLTTACTSSEWSLPLLPDHAELGASEQAERDAPRATWRREGKPIHWALSAWFDKMTHPLRRRPTSFRRLRASRSWTSCFCRAMHRPTSRRWPTSGAKPTFSPFSDFSFSDFLV